MGKYRLLRDRVAAGLPALELLEAPPRSDGELALAHTPRYIDAVSEGLLSAAEQREIGFPWIEADGRALAPFGRRDDRRGARAHSTTASRPTSPAARTTRAPTRAAATACSTTSRSRRG